MITGHAAATFCGGLVGDGEILFVFENKYVLGGLISVCCEIKSLVLFDDESDDVGG
jgi:hypothetical protein